MRAVNHNNVRNIFLYIIQYTDEMFEE